MMNAKGHQKVHNWLQHGTRLMEDPIPVVALAELYFYSLQYDRYFSSSHFVRISIALKEYICGMNYSRGWRIPLPYTDGKQER